MAALWQGSPEFYHLAQRRSSHLEIWANELNPERNGGHDPFSIDGDSYFARRAIQSIRSEPLTYVKYSMQKAAYFWFGNPAAEWAFLGQFGWLDWQTLRQWYPYSWPRLINMFLARNLPMVAFGALVFLAIRGRLRPLLPLLVVGASFMLVHMVTYAEMRHSEPLHPILAIIVAAAAGESFDRFLRKQPL